MNETQTHAKVHFTGIFTVFHILCFMFSLFLSLRCNGKFVFLETLFSLFAPYIYIPMKLGLNMNECFPKN